jgi:hypothetical protein
MAKQSTLEEFLNENRKLSSGESLNENTKLTNDSEMIYSDKKRKQSGIYKTLMGSGLISGIGYMLANSYIALGNPNASFGYGMTYGQAEASGLAIPALELITLIGVPLILLGGYVVRSGFEDLIKGHKKLKKYEIEKFE